MDVVEIDKGTATRIVVRNHYLHRTCPISHAYALCDEDAYIRAVVTYGVPCSSTLLKGVCGPSEQHNVYELNRLWVSSSMPRNSASMLVGRSLKMLDKEIVVSFADSSRGHVGYVYQATNFLYCGLSAKFKDPVVRGFEGMHHATFAHGMTKRQIEERFGKENVTWVDRPRKHRYVYINARGKRRKQLIGKLRYEVLPYPKGEASHAEDCEEVIEQYNIQLPLF